MSAQENYSRFLERKIVASTEVGAYIVELWSWPDGPVSDYVWRATKGGKVCKKWPPHIADVGHAMTIAAKMACLRPGSLR